MNNPKFVKLFLEHKRKTYIDNDKMCFYIDNNETKMWLIKKHFFPTQFYDFYVLINPDWKYTIYLKDKTKAEISGHEIIEKIKSLLNKKDNNEIKEN